jgi:UDP-glucose 4-epimerase
MNILVTGGAGFIASHIVDAYCSLGHYVTVVDDLSTGRPENLNPAATFRKVDIRDAAGLAKVFDEKHYDLVNHHAAQMDVRRSVADPVHDASVNVLGALTLFESCRRTGVPRLIFASSGGAIYGEQERFPADESHPTRPMSPYGVAKLTTEQYLYYYKAVYGIEAVCLRYANVYGPRQNPEGEAGVVAIFITRLLRNEQPVINGDGKQTRDYVFVGDVVRANVLALDCAGSEIFNIGTGTETNVNTIFSLARTSTGSTSPERHGEAKKGEQRRSVLSSEKIRRSLGWTSTVLLEAGIGETAAFFKNRNDDAKKPRRS